MSQENYGIAEIEQERREVDRFQISWDYDDDPSDKSQRKAVFLIVPNDIAGDHGGLPEHHHITLTRKGAMALKDWLTEFLELPK